MSKRSADDILPAASAVWLLRGHIKVLTQDGQELYVRHTDFTGWITAINELFDTRGSTVYLHNMTAATFMQLLAIQRDDQLIEQALTAKEFLDLLELITYWDIQSLLHLFVPRLASALQALDPLEAEAYQGCCQLWRNIGMYFQWNHGWGIVHACNAGNAAAVRFLLASPLLNPPEAAMTAALMHACGANSNVVQLLVASGKLPVDWQSSTGVAALGVACDIGNMAIVRVLLDAGVRPGKDALVRALEEQHADVALFLLEHQRSRVTSEQMLQLKLLMPGLYEQLVPRQVRPRLDHLVC
jgi:hypothetical protein